MSSSNSSSSFEGAFRDTLVNPPGIEEISTQRKTVSEAERVLVEHSNRWSMLYVLCIGLETTTNDAKTKPLLDFNDDSFKNLKKKDIKPSLEHLRNEITRRSLLDDTPKKPKPKGWNFSKCLQWLMQNPVTNADDVVFLEKKVAEVIQIAAAAADCQGDEDSGKNWVGPLPYLCLIHCLLEDDIHDKWIHRNDPRSIQEIDARNSEVRVETAYEMIASRWNSTTFNPKTTISNCHYDFKEEHDVGHKACSEFARATAIKVKDKLARMKTDLTTIIQKWERSGQGDGGIEEEKDDEEDNPEQFGDSPQAKVDWGRSKGRTGAFDCRDSFLAHHPSYLLYFWDVLDQTDLFNTTMNRLSDETGASSPNEVPGIILTGRNSSKTNDSEDGSAFISNFRNILVEASEKASLAADRRHRENKIDTERRHKETQVAQDKRHKEAQVAQDKRVVLKNNLVNKGYLKRRIDSLQDEARNIRLKIFECQESNQSNKEKFFSSELKTIEKEIEKCTKDIEQE